MDYYVYVMVKTRTDLKIKIKEFVNKQEEPFKTVDVQEYSKKISSNIYVSPQRLQNYIRQVEGVKFDKTKREWNNQKINTKTVQG